MQIRHAIKEDLVAISEIWNYYILHSTYNYDAVPRPADFFETWFLKKRETGIPVFVVEAEGKVVGYGSYSQFRDREGYKHSAEHGMYFHPDYPGRGWGTLLLNQLLADGKERGFHMFVAVIDSSNDGSIRFHERNGFVRIGTMKEVGRKNGQWLDLVFLQKII